MNELERFAAFNSGLASLLRSGLPLDGALDSLARELTSGRFRKAVERVEADVRRGRSLSDAVAEERVFPRYYGALLRAGEEGGKLPEILFQAAREARASARTTRRLQVSLIYPALVIACAFAVMCVLGRFVTDTFSRMFREMGMADWLPLTTRLVFWAGEALPWIGFGGLGVMAAAGLYSALARRLGLPRITPAVLGFLPLVRAGEVARFAGTLDLLTSSGINLPAALELVAGVMHVRSFKRACLRASRRVAEGEGLAAALKEERTFPRFFTWAVGVEEGGPGLGETLREMERLYDERARGSGELLVLLVAPAALILAGLVIGFIVVAMFMPLVSLIQTI